MSEGVAGSGAPSCGGHPKRGDVASILLTLGMPGIVGSLHANPNSGAVAEQLAEANRDARRDGLTLAQNVMEMLTGNAEKPRDLGLGPAGRRNHILPQQGARMGRTAIRVTLGDMSHGWRSLVILFEVHAASIAVIEFEGDAPRPIYMDRLTRWLEAAQGV